MIKGKVYQLHGFRIKKFRFFCIKGTLLLIKTSSVGCVAYISVITIRLEMWKTVSIIY